MKLLVRLGSLILFIALIGISTVASAGVVVDPDDLKSGLTIKTKKVDGAKQDTPINRSKDEPAPEKGAFDQRNEWGGIPCITLQDGSPQCFGTPAVPPPADAPELTPGQILKAVREIGMPRLKINIQPGGTTLINLDTIFYAQPRPFRRSVTLLDHDIDITATPTAFTWNHGDNTSHTTQSPGAPYPSKDVVYRYQHKAQDLHPSVDVTYKVRYRVDNGPWQDLGQTLTTTGPTNTLDIKEATAVLTSY